MSQNNISHTEAQVRSDCSQQQGRSHPHFSQGLHLRYFANHLASVIDGTNPDPVSLDYPGIEDGIRGMAFIEAVVASSHHNARWTSLPA